MKIIKIGAEWCPGCIVMKPRWKEIESEITDLKTEYYDFDKDKNIVNKYLDENSNLPAFIFLDRKGNELEKLHGEISKKDLIELVNRYKNK